MASWELEDVAETARRHPETFFIPSGEERAGIQPGELVRLHFVLRQPGPDDPRAERMWVEVAERLGSGASVTYRGRLTNQPGYIADLHPGDTVEFGPAHVARVLLPASHADALEIGEKKALVSARALEPGARACWAYRQEPDHEEDSGWRLFRGDESEEYLDDGSNARICNVYWLAERDPTLRRIFRAPIGAAFERADPMDEWSAVEGWEAPE